jgi:hypothetical protein
MFLATIEGLGTPLCIPYLLHVQALLPTAQPGCTVPLNIGSLSVDYGGWPRSVAEGRQRS